MPYGRSTSEYKIAGIASGQLDEGVVGVEKDCMAGEKQKINTHYICIFDVLTSYISSV